MRHFNLVRGPHVPFVHTCKSQTFLSTNCVSLVVNWELNSSCRGHTLRSLHLASHRPVRKRSIPARCNTCSVHFLVVFVLMATSPSKIPRLRHPKASNPSATVKTHKHVLTNNNSNTSHINGPGTIINHNPVTNHIDVRPAAPPVPPAPLVRSEICLVVFIYLIALQRRQRVRDATTEANRVPWSRRVGR